MPGVKKKFLPAVDPNQKWLTVPEAATYLRVSPQLIRRALHDGSLKAAPFGQGYLLDRVDLDQFVMRPKRVIPPYRRGSRPWVAKRWSQHRREKSA